MKKLVLAAIATAVLPTLVLAQGTISFGSTTADQYIQYQNLAKAGGVTAQLWWSPDNLVAYSMIASTLTGTGGAAGYIAPAVLATTGPATAGGASAWFYVRGQDGALAGVTPNFQAVTGAPNATPPTTPGTLDGWTTPITLVPEPSTFALAGLGVAALFLFRRRN